MAAIANKYRQELIENIANYNDDILHKYIENIDISESEIISALRKITLEVNGVPVLCGASFKNKGIQHLLDAVINFLPSPVDISDPKGINPDSGEDETRKARDDESFSGLLFKVMTDPFVGKLNYVRIYSGSLKVGTQVLKYDNRQQGKGFQNN